MVVVEDLISTGGSSLSAVRALREAGCQVPGMVAIFTYEFKKAADAFSSEGCSLYTLSSYSELIRSAVESGYINESDLETLKSWRENPSSAFELSTGAPDPEFETASITIYNVKYFRNDRYVKL